MKVLKNPIFTFILGAIIFGSITGVIAYNVSANIEFTPDDQDWEVENVQGALNDLYSKKQIDVSNMTLVDRKNVKGYNANKLSSTYTNINKGIYFVYAIRTSTVNQNAAGIFYAESTSRYSENSTSAIPTITVSSGTITKIDDEFSIIRVTDDNSTITINSLNTGSSTAIGGYLYSSIYAVN